MNAEEVKAYARKIGADLVGIASIDRFTHLPADKNPLSIAPECQSVIVLGKRILRGSLRGVEEGTNFDSTFGYFGFRWLEDHPVSRLSYDMICHLETQGFEGIPLFAYVDEGMPKGAAVAPDKPAPNVILDWQYAACAAGLGEIGLGDFFLTPQYGTRQRFAIVLTDAKLDADAVQGKSICSDCGACANACPFGAIDMNKKQKVGVPGFEYEVATVDYAKCRQCPNGAMQLPGHGTRPDRIAAACGRQCLVQLETGGKAGQQFSHTFRKRKPWVRDFFSKSLPIAEGTDASQIGCGKRYGRR